MTTGGPRWEIQRYDAHWGGWKAVATAFDDDSPARFKTRALAREQAQAYLASNPSYRVRVFDRATGQATKVPRPPQVPNPTPEPVDEPEQFGLVRQHNAAVFELGLLDLTLWQAHYDINAYWDRVQAIKAGV